jgi:hypothetical protein
VQRDFIGTKERLLAIGALTHAINNQERTSSRLRDQGMMPRAAMVVDALAAVGDKSTHS